MLVWEEQNYGSPALLVLKQGYFTSDLTKTAYSLGYKWGIYCDVNFYDNAGYWENGQNRVQFSYFNEQGKRPYHRMVLYR